MLSAMRNIFRIIESLLMLEVNSKTRGVTEDNESHEENYKASSVYNAESTSVYTES